MSILGVVPRAIPYDVSTEITVSGAGFTFPLQVLLRSGQSVLELNVSSIGINTIKASAHVYNPPGAPRIPLGTVDLEVFSPTTGQRVVCPACISLLP
jgi:hypothetical protein